MNCCGNLTNKMMSNKSYRQIRKLEICTYIPHMDTTNQPISKINTHSSKYRNIQRNHTFNQWTSLITFNSQISQTNMQRYILAKNKIRKPKIQHKTKQAKEIGIQFQKTASQHQTTTQTKPVNIYQWTSESSTILPHITREIHQH